MNAVTFNLLKCTGDEDLVIIKENYSKPEVERFVSIDKDKFWKYVTETENVYFYKIYNNSNLVGTMQCEVYDGILYLALVIFPEYQKKKIGTSAVQEVIVGKTGLSFKEIQVSIDEKNTASLKLFQNVGFKCSAQEDSLIDFRYIM